MRFLVIGGGGREHAIAWRLAQEGHTVYATPGNPGLQKIGECIRAGASTPEAYLSMAEAIDPDLTVVGPEAPLVAGTVDLFRSNRRPIFGPTKAAAALEGSKLFAKRVMVNAGIPTARYLETASLDDAINALDRFEYPVVLKADGLAAGKGVVIAENRTQATDALHALTEAIGPRILIEEYLEGEEASFIVLSDGTRTLPLEASQDHKRIFDNDEGPNTGGMGAYSDSRILTASEIRQVTDAIIAPTIDYMQTQGTPFSGFLYAGLMMTADGPKVLEFNVRLGDPETQALLHRIEGGFADALIAAAAGDLRDAAIRWKPDPSVCIVAAAAGYPDRPRVGDVIHGIEAAESSGATVFHAGTRLDGGDIVTAGGRVLGVTASGASLPLAIDNAYAALRHISFSGMQYRHDIGRKGLKRW